MDGTLVNTEPYWMDAETDLIESFGGTWSHEQALELVGNGLIDSAIVLQGAGVRMGAVEIVDELTERVRVRLQKDGVPFRPGAREMLRGLRDAGIRTGLVTMSLRRMAEDIVDLIGFDAFDVIVGGDDVERPKPFPDPYLRAAELLGVDIADTIALEDSRTGLQAAVASQAVAIGVPHLVDLDGVGADAIWDTFEGRTVDDLFAEFGRARSCRAGAAS
ncbi:HAD-IA family hydrolase [Microbacterium sp. ASV81]|uniref:HAD-IA family hydrolase n=2 Tax=Microbacterium capsulatum TaxID=3041921 RepID=A0ABU0XCL1_9MICO|nr:HAD-IA family hydrolase [Microbacterium sp. ASV81]MDQ4212852.1 HAD-IA family hydrolase [Microbacterium sp. ASV81]